MSGVGNRASVETYSNQLFVPQGFVLIRGVYYSGGDYTMLGMVVSVGVVSYAYDYKHILHNI